MDGLAVTGGVTRVTRGDLVFAVAGPEDAADIRRLLRENPLGGRFGITLERGLGDLFDDHDQVVIIARERASGQAIGLCERTVRPGYVDGEVRPLPYLGALRVTERHRHRIAVLRGGFEALRALAERPTDLPFALTSITSDNTVARRVLTANLAGLPAYRSLGDFSSFALRPVQARIAPEISAATEADLPTVAGFLRRENVRFQYSPVWTEQGLRGAGLRAEHFLLARTGNEIRGCVAVWDQRAQRQTVIRRYPPLLATLRPLINLAAPALKLPYLPAEGSALAQATLSHLAVADDRPATFLGLVAAALDQAKRRGFQAAILGFASSRPWREELLWRFRAIEYRTTLYLAYWRDAAARVAALRPSTPHPELGLL